MDSGQDLTGECGVCVQLRLVWHLKECNHALGIPRGYHDAFGDIVFHWLVYHGYMYGGSLKEAMAHYRVWLKLT
jgi:hypothetical protein